MCECKTWEVTVSSLQHRFSEVDGVHLHWAQLGEPGEHPPLVLLHGLTDSHLTWYESAPELARDRLVLMPDLPGCGLSSRPDASYELSWHADVIAHWLEQLGLTSVDVVGHSFGGGVAQMLLLACPERIRRVVLVAAGGLGREVGFWLKLATFPHFVERYGQPFMAFGTRRALCSLYDERSQPQLDELLAMNARRGTARAFSRTVRDVINFQGQTRQFLQRAHEVRAFPPIAVLWGEQDSLIPIAHGRRFVLHMRGAVFRSFAGCGHYLHRDRPDEFVRVVRVFLDSPTAAQVTLEPRPEPKAAVPTRLRRALHSVVRRRVRS